ncbi:MAG: signal peptidase I [Chitinispirillales bacterium]|nr:signal peptidase I [Chitinispirillales bacterium]
MRSFFEKARSSADLRLALRSGAGQFVLVLAIGLLIKLFVFDSIKIDGLQMEPAIRAGDRVLLFKAPYTIPLVRNFFTHAGKPVIVNFPGKNTKTVLRIAAVSGDTVYVSYGQFYRNRYPIEKLHKDMERFGIIPSKFSPIDFMPVYVIPSPKDSIIFSELTLRDLIFTYSILRQENANARLKAFIMVGDSAIGNYYIKDFSLYSGRLDSIPKEFYTDWFFWDRLQEYLYMTADGETPQLAFSVFKGNREITGFRVKKRYIFLVGDNWNEAKDSRYFGPVVSTNVLSRPVATLWGVRVDENGKRRFDFKKICRAIR